MATAASAAGPTPPHQSSLHRFGSRTNALAFAKTDCLSCSAQRERCDRRRPHCGTCSSQGRSCDGFANTLVWKDTLTLQQSESKGSFSDDSDHNVEGSMSVQRYNQKQPSPSSSTSSQKNSSSQKMGQKPQQQTLRFVSAQPGKKRRKKRSNQMPGSAASGMFSKFSLHLEPQHGGRGGSRKSSSPKSTAGSTSPETVATSGWDEAEASACWTISLADSPDDYTSQNGAAVDIPESLPLGSFDESAGFGYFHVQESAPPMTDCTDLMSFTSQLGSSQFETSSSNAEESQELNLVDLFSEALTEVRYVNIMHKYRDVLLSYDSEFCVIPLSADCRTNPFRIEPGHLERFPFLLHGVLAISGRHMARKNGCMELEDYAFNHWSAALRLLSNAIGYTVDFLPLLDTILLLANFEAMQSAYNMVNMHLEGALKMCEQVGALELSRESPRLRAQLAMLVWWDATMSLMARREPRLPASYLQSLMRYDDDGEGGDGDDGWSSYILNGCPLAFITSMRQLAALAAAFDRTEGMDHVFFDMEAVDAVIEQVQSYQDSITTCMEPLPGDLPDTMDSRLDRSHCIEAWRNGILLYAQRVFRRTHDEDSIERITYLSRTILDYVRCIPRTKTIQKQVLLPLFLAASETGNKWNRAFVREYCRHWDVVSRFSQFKTVGALLEDIWRDWSPHTRAEYWWGMKVPSAANSSEQELSMARMLQLG